MIKEQLLFGLIRIGGTILHEISEKCNILTIEEACSSTLFDISKLTKKPADRSEFWEDDSKMEWYQFSSKWMRQDMRMRVANLLKPLINRTPLRGIVFKIIKKNKAKRFEKRVQKANNP